MFKIFGKDTNKLNRIHEKTRSRLLFENACHNSVHFLSSSHLPSKNKEFIYSHPQCYAVRRCETGDLNSTTGTKVRFPINATIKWR
jgi:hypothetical protein